MPWTIFFQPVKAAFSVVERSESQKARLRLLAPFLPVPRDRPYFLIAVDTTPAPRPFAKTLEDRQIVYQPNPAPGNNPVTVGHHFSTVVILPEKAGQSKSWAIPLRIERVPSGETGTDMAISQIEELMDDKELPFHNKLTVGVADSSFSIASFLGRACDIDNLVTIVRCRGNRVFFRFPESSTTQPSKGRPKCFGERFDMKDPHTWQDPDQSIDHLHIRPSGNQVTIRMEVWNNLLMSGKRGIPMHHNPFSLIRIRMLNDDGSPIFKKSLWLIVAGKRRDEIPIIDVWQCYRQRYDIEHFYRFGKGKLLLASYQTPDAEHEENWWEIAGLAYFQLWMARPLAESAPHPWERYAQQPPENPRSLGPSEVQKDFERIIRQYELTLPPPKPRGKSPGRVHGYSPGRRKRHPIVFKGGEEAA
ncbi:MAG: transposase [Magnetococcus sp. YQC-5]